MRPIRQRTCRQILFLPGLAFLFLLPSVSPAQFNLAGDGGDGAATVSAPVTATAKDAARLLDEEITLGDVNVTVGDLEPYLQEKLEGVGVFVDADALEMAKVDPATPIVATIQPMPLRAALRKMLAPLALKPIVEDEGIVIAADFVELTRRGIATDMSLMNESGADARIRETLSRSVSVAANEEPLGDVISRLSNIAEIPIIIDGRSLEEIGLSENEPVTADLNDISLESVLRIILRDLDLTYMIQDEVLRIMTIEAAEQNLLTHIYFLEGIGSDSKQIVKLIQSTVVPDCWDILGGPCTIQHFLAGTRNRPSLVIDATTDVHQRIRLVLAGIRKSGVGMNR